MRYESGERRLLVDVHCHIDDQAFDDDRDEVIKRASDVVILNAGVDPPSNRKTLEMAGKYPNVKACLGLHPEFIARFSDALIEDEIGWIRKQSKRIVAISEIGLDFYWVKEGSQRERQKKLLRRMLNLAEELDLPVITHSRDAARDTLAILREYPKLGIILHGFSEPDNMGHLVSVAPNLYRNKAKQRQVRELSLEDLLTETDSPQLGIDPKERNEPANIVKVIEKIADLKNIDPEKVGTTIVGNARKFFGDSIFFQINSSISDT
ncbi:MAG: TatD family hydrolase [Promethearchaeati archaeon SRVP18_Atabeyarchaeia-1]